MIKDIVVKLKRLVQWLAPAEGYAIPPQPPQPSTRTLLASRSSTIPSFQLWHTGYKIGGNQLGTGLGPCRQTSPLK